MARKDRELEGAEDMLVEAWGYLMRLPDRDYGFLSSGQRSWWPAIVRDRVTDYADDSAPRLPGLGRREMALVGRVFLDDDCLMMEVVPDLRGLMALVLAMKARPSRGGFRWEHVWEAMGGRAAGVTSDGLRARYERCLGRIAVADAVRREGEEA